MSKKEKAAHARMRTTPLGRLDIDGASKAVSIRRRMQWIASEWKIPDADLPRVKKHPTAAFGRFVDQYGISWDWLLFGDLKALQRMMHKRGVKVADGGPA